MLYSNVEKSWLRVELMYITVNEYFSLTKNSDFRKRRIKGESFFPYSVSDYQNMNKESSLVEITMVSGVIALESLINYGLAELQDDFELSKKSINNPNKILKERGVSLIPQSKLAKKILILKKNPNHPIIKLTDILSDNRNKITHDKPFDFSVYERKEVTKHYNDSNTYCKSYQYEDLKDFFIECDKVKTYIIEDSVLENLQLSDFSTLIK